MQKKLVGKIRKSKAPMKRDAGGSWVKWLSAKKIKKKYEESKKTHVNDTVHLLLTKHRLKVDRNSRDLWTVSGGAGIK